MKSFLSVVLFSVAFGASAKAQSLPARTSSLNFDAVATVNITRANAGPGSCGCFYMYGENGQLLVKHQSGLAFVFDYEYSSARTINGVQGRDLNLSTYLDGIRYTSHVGRNLQMYGQLLVGVGHTDSTYPLDHRATKFAYMAGGGVDYQLGQSHFAIKLAEIDFLATKIPNGVNDRQNQVRVTTGIVFHLNRGE